MTNQSDKPDEGGRRTRVAKVPQIDPHGGSPGSDRFLKRQRARAVRRGADPKALKGYQT